MPTAEAAAHLRSLAEPWGPGGVKAAINRAARKAKISAGLAKRLWYGEARRIDAETMDKLRAAVRERAARTQESARAEYRLLVKRIEACEAALGLSGPNVGRAADHAGELGARPAHRPMDRAES